MAHTEARKEAKRIAQERGLGGLANDTKWREFFTQVMERQLALEVKIIYEDAPSKIVAFGLLQRTIYKAVAWGQSYSSSSSGFARSPSTKYKR
jgi:hypothetical protein